MRRWHCIGPRPSASYRDAFSAVLTVCLVVGLVIGGSRLGIMPENSVSAPAS